LTLDVTGATPKQTIGWDGTLPMGPRGIRVSFDRFEVSEVGDGIVVVAMSRPNKLNAMDRLFFDELSVLMREVPDAGADVIVLTGQGRAFSAGGDIETFATLTETTTVRRHLRAVYDAFHSVERAEVPVIGAVNGIAYGGGTELVLACDLALASSSAQFAFKEATVGLTPGYGIIRGPEVIGRRWTRRLAMTGETIGADMAQQIGLVEEVVEPEALVDRAVALARRISASAPLGVRVAKQFINRDQSAPGQAESIEATALLFTTDEHERRVANFLAGDRPAKD
jgi:enoyl-CoA hydratase